MNPLFAIILSSWDWMVILFIVLLLYGNRLPSVMRSIGQGVTEFKKGLEGIEDDKDKAVKKDDEPKKADQQQPQT